MKKKHSAKVSKEHPISFEETSSGDSSSPFESILEVLDSLPTDLLDAGSFEGELSNTDGYEFVEICKQYSDLSAEIQTFVDKLRDFQQRVALSSSSQQQEEEDV